MNLSSRKSTRPASDESQEPAKLPERPQVDAPKPAQEANSSVSFERSGSRYTVAVVCESFCQEHLRLFFDDPMSSADLYFRAYLYNEDDNPNDDQAVRVEIHRHTVGYLSREDARAYRQWLSRERPGADVLTCGANVRGGWDRGKGDRGQIGVWLDLPI